MNRRGKKHKQNSFEIQKRKYEQEYLKGKRKVLCPALKAEIQFSNKALLHLSQEKYREPSEKIERLKLLSVARHIIQNSNFYQDYRFQDFHEHFIFEAVLNKKKIRVIVYESQKEYILLSCFYVNKKE